MRRTLIAGCVLAAALVGGAASCDTPQPSQSLLFTCNSYADTLNKLAELREQQKLPPAIIKSVDKTRVAMDDVCLAPPPNVDASVTNTLVDSGVRFLAAIVRQFVPGYTPPS